MSNSHKNVVYNYVTDEISVLKSNKESLFFSPPKTNNLLNCVVIYKLTAV